MVKLSGMGFLGALRLSDSALPTGMFTQSHSLEAFVQTRRVNNPDDVKKLLESMLIDQVAPSDAVAAAWAWRATTTADVASVVSADRALHATKLCQEMRDGSRRSGGRLLHLGAALTNNRFLVDLQDRAAKNGTPGHYATAFGALAAVLDVPLEATVIIELYSFASSFLGAAMRLLRFDHMDAQVTLARLEPLILKLATNACRTTLADIRTFSPMVDIMSMHHEHGRVRLFSS